MAGLCKPPHFFFSWSSWCQPGCKTREHVSRPMAGCIANVFLCSVTMCRPGARTRSMPDSRPLQYLCCISIYAALSGSCISCMSMFLWLLFPMSASRAVWAVMQLHALVGDQDPRKSMAQRLPHHLCCSFSCCKVEILVTVASECKSSGVCCCLDALLSHSLTVTRGLSCVHNSLCGRCIRLHQRSVWHSGRLLVVGASMSSR